MPGIHDIGGVHGFGAVMGDDEDVAHVWEAWEARVYGLTRALRHNGVHASDEFRYAIESLPPAQYLGAGYYERWLAGLEHLLVGKGVLQPGELDRRVREEQATPEQATPEQATEVPTTQEPATDAGRS